MTDDQNWQAPGTSSSGARQPAAGQPGTEPPAATGVPIPPPAPPESSPYAPAASASPPSVPQPGGWTPPPKPGLIPLRPLDLGTLLGAAFRVLRRNPRPTFGAAVLLQSVTMVASLLFIGGFLVASLMRLGFASSGDQTAIIAGTVGLGVVATLATVFLGVIAQALLQGIIVIEVARGSLGEKLTLRKLWAFTRGRRWALIGWAAILAGALLIAIGLVTLVIVLLIVTMGAIGIGIGILVGILGVLALVVLGVWLGTKLCLVPSALMLERVKLSAAVARSWALTNGSFWKVFGIQALVSIILGVATNVALIPFSIAAPLLVGLLDPNGTNSTFLIIAMVGIYILQIVVSIVISAITSIISTATTALIYLDLRMRKEGLDLELTRFVEARHTGAGADENPYLREEPPGPSAGYVFA